MAQNFEDYSFFWGEAGYHFAKQVQKNEDDEPYLLFNLKNIPTNARWQLALFLDFSYLKSLCDKYGTLNEDISSLAKDDKLCTFSYWLSQSIYVDDTYFIGKVAGVESYGEQKFFKVRNNATNITGVKNQQWLPNFQVEIRKGQWCYFDYEEEDFFYIPILSENRGMMFFPSSGGSWYQYGKGGYEWYKSKNSSFFYPLFRAKSEEIKIYNSLKQELLFEAKTNEEKKQYEEKVKNIYTLKFEKFSGDFAVCDVFSNDNFLKYLTTLNSAKNLEALKTFFKDQKILFKKNEKIKWYGTETQVSVSPISYNPFKEAEDKRIEEEEKKTLEELFNEEIKKDNSKSEDLVNNHLMIFAKNYPYAVACKRFEGLDVYFSDKTKIGSLDLKQLKEKAGLDIIGVGQETFTTSIEDFVPIALAGGLVEQLEEKIKNNSAFLQKLKNSKNSKNETIVYVKIADVTWRAGWYDESDDLCVLSEEPQTLKEFVPTKTDKQTENRKENEQKDNKLLWLAIAAGALILMK